MKKWWFGWNNLWGYVYADSVKEARREAATRIKKETREKPDLEYIAVERRKDPEVDRGGNPYRQSDADFIYFLENTLIPDLEVSGSEGYVKDFDDGVRFYKEPDLRGAADHADYLINTIGKDSMESGMTETAKDLIRLGKMIQRKLKKMSGYRVGNPKSMTLKKARGILTPLGMSIRHRDGEYKVNFIGAPPATAYYTNDIEDAVNSGVDMARRQQEMGGPPPGPAWMKREANPSGGLPDRIANDPAFKKELAAYRKRHGTGPVEIREVDVPAGYPKFMSAWGNAPEIKYDAPGHSNKGKRVHKFGEGKGRGQKPFLVSSVEKGKKFLAFVGGKFRADGEWIHD